MIVVGFAGKSGNDIGADSGVRQLFANEFNAARVMFGSDTSDAWPQEYDRKRTAAACGSVGARRGVEAKSATRSAVTSRGSMELMRRRSTEVSARIWRSRSRKSTRGERSRPQAAEIDAAENDFFVARIGEAADFCDDGIGRKTAAFSADERNDTKRAAGIAAVLDFKSGASVMPFPAEDRSDENVGEVEDVASKDRSGR